jgi:hypothetical protein
MPDQNLLALRRDSRRLIRNSDLLTDGFWGRYWLDVALLIALVLVCLALLRDAHIPAAQKRLIASKNGILPFHLIEIADVRLEGMNDTLPPPERTADVVGRYPFTYVPGGAAINSNQLSSSALSPHELSDRVLVRLKVQATTLFAGMKPPFRASLMGSPSEHGTTVLLERDVIVLDLQQEGDSMAAVLAVRSADEPMLAAFIARSDLLLVVGRR